MDWLSDERMPQIVAGLAWLALLVSAILHRRLAAGFILRSLAGWTAIGAVLLLGYSYRHDLAAMGARMLGELVPHRAGVTERGEVRLRAGQDGHFRLDIEVNGTLLRFLVDTGASSVVLAPADAAKLGFARGRLDFTRKLSTAGGTAWGAPVVLERVSVGPIALRDLPALVIETPMAESLLGLTFLGRLSGYRVEGETLVLTP